MRSNDSMPSGHRSLGVWQARRIIVVSVLFACPKLAEGMRFERMQGCVILPSKLFHETSLFKAVHRRQERGGSERASFISRG
jgi:hypothetical protein